ncbi:MAG: DEAD/DEAH box helicase [Promethearchaeota archaeon]
MSEIPSLKEYEWKRTYKSIHGNLVKEFLIPALERSILYKRVAGYFSSSVLVAAAGGIARLLKNDGEMRLIVGADLSPQDVEALNKDPDKIMDIIQNKIPDNLNELDELERFITERRFDALSWMLYKRKLKIKIALVLDENNKIAENQDLAPIFHEKWGIFYDESGDFLGFNGSVNESMKGWLENRENFDVYFSWDFSIAYLENKIDDFESYWGDVEPGIKVYDVSDAVEQKLIRFRKKNPPYKDPVETPKSHLKSFKTQSDDRNKIIGVYNDLNFMEPEEFRFKQIAGYLNSVLGLQHNWNMLLNTISFTPMNHQEIISYEIYKNYPRGYILCDEVGLGKTIEAGLAVKWLILAGKVKRVLIIVPKNIVKQWQEELREKFNLEFYIYDGRNFISYWNEKYKFRTYNAYNAVDLVLVSSGLVQLERRKQELLNSYEWDLVIFDEAHHLRRKPPKRVGGEGATTRLLKLAQELKKKTKCFLLMTATPIQMRIQEVFDLLKLLGLGGKWGLKENFDKFYTIVGHKVEKRTMKDWQFLVEMAKDYLKWGRINKVSYEDELFEHGGKFQSDFKRIFLKNDDFTSYIQENLDNANYLKEFSNELEILSPLRWYMFRNTRNQLREYGINVPVRVPNDVPISMKGRERQLYREIETYLRDIYKKSKPEQKSIIGFTLAIYRRRLTSSFSAIKETLKRRLEILKYERDGETEHITSFFDEEDIDDDIIEEFNVESSDLETELEPSGSDSEEDSYYEFDDDKDKKKKRVIILAKDSLDEEIDYLEKFIEDIEDFLERNQESKFEIFKSQLEKANLKDAKKMLVFTQYTDTLKFLRKKLRDNPNYQNMGCYSGSGGELLVQINGTSEFKWEKKTKEEIKNWFFEEGEFKIMICTDAASEGLNFQVCNWMINYDLPWNPMKVEQRIGRIDRVQQKAEKLFIFNLIYTESIEGRIYKKLWERIRLFQNTIGPLRPILNVYQKAERFAIEEGDDALTEEEINRMLGNIKEESTRALQRHEFFIQLLKRRIIPSLRTEQDMSAIIDHNEILSWFYNYFNDKNLIIKNADFSLKFLEKRGDSLDLLLIENNSRDLFLPYNSKLIKSKTKKEQRNYSKTPYKFSITTDPLHFTSFPSNYYFTEHCLLYSNLVRKFLPFRERLLPAILKSGEINKINNIQVITRIIISKYPLLNNELYLVINIDINSWEIKEMSQIKSFKEVDLFLTEIKSNLDNKGIFLKRLEEINLSPNRIKEIIRKALRDEKLSIELNLEDRIKSFNWEEYEKSFKSLKKSAKSEIKSEITIWLIMEYLSNLRDDDWNNFTEKIYLEECYEKLLIIEDYEKIEKIIEEFNFDFESMQISKDNETFVNLVNQYQNKKRRKLIKANQGILRTRIISLIDKYYEEIKLYKSRKMEFIRLAKINHPQVLVCGIIFN